MKGKKIEIENIILVIMFGIMFIANSMSPLCIDDFAYALSQATHERITSFVELLLSVKAYNANGRYIACFLIQTCLMFPKVVFNILNSLIFIFQIILLRKLCCADGKKNWKVMLGGIGLIWCFLPAFGEDYLWLCAAITYSWGATLCLLYTWYFARYMHKMEVYTIRTQIGICILGFFAGAYAETTAILAVTVPVIYCVVIRLINKEKIKTWMILSEISACGGLLFLVTRPAENIKVLEPSFLGYLTCLKVLIIQYVNAFWVLLFFLLFFTMFVLIKIKKSKKMYSVKKFMDSIIYMVISLGINGAMIFASSYPSRVMLLTGLFLFLAVLSFLYEAKDIIHYERLVWHIGSTAVGIVMVCFVIYGMYDICDYGIKINALYVDIEKQVEEGKTKIIISECPEYNSKYINYNEYAYFNIDPKNYVNEYFMRYMGYNGTIQVEDKNLQ